MQDRNETHLEEKCPHHPYLWEGSIYTVKGGKSIKKGGYVRVNHDGGRHCTDRIRSSHPLGSLIG
jgi:hypothetical protein